MRAANFLLICTGIILLSCEKPPFFEKAYAFNENRWEQNVQPRFLVNIQDTTRPYDFTITLRTTTDYKYNNLWVFITTITPDGQRVREPYEIKITQQNGQWIGKKTGTIVENTLSFKQRRLPKKGSYVFILEQGITASTIDEVLDLSMKVEESKKA